MPTAPLPARRGGDARDCMTPRRDGALRGCAGFMLARPRPGNATRGPRPRRLSSFSPAVSARRGSAPHPSRSGAGGLLVAGGVEEELAFVELLGAELGDAGFGELEHPGSDVRDHLAIVGDEDAGAFVAGERLGEGAD